MSIDNNVLNVVKLNGETNLVNKVMNELIRDYGYFTFDTFAPVPSELLSTSPLQEVYSNDEYAKIMDDYVCKLNNNEISIHDVMPISYEIQHRLILLYGHDNWYDWAMHNWGCKSNVYGSEILSENSFSFYSVNATPHSAMLKMSMKYPGIEFIITYADEDIGYNVGSYSVLNGETTNVELFDSFSKDSFLHAFRLFNDDYYINEMIHGLTEEELIKAINNEDEYLYSIILAILEMEVVDEYNPILNQFLLTQAVNNEQYEYADKLNKILNNKELI